MTMHMRRFTENQSGASGGGMSVFSTKLITTRNCTFLGNYALSSGALDYVRDRPHEPVFLQNHDYADA